MRKLTLKDAAWSWSNKEENELNELKKTICEYPTFTILQCKRPCSYLM